MIPLFICGIGMQEILLIILVILPFTVLQWQEIIELMKGFDKGACSFKEGMNNMKKKLRKNR